MRWNEFVRDYLSFTRKERIGVIVIIFLITSIFFLPVAFSKRSGTDTHAADSTVLAAIKRLEVKDSSSAADQYNTDNNSQYYQYDKPTNRDYALSHAELFYFDPNTASAGDWKKLGLREKTIGTIQNYLSKGGRFRKPEDLQRIYGLFPDEYKRIAPYIQIEPVAVTNNYPANKPAGNTPPKNTGTRYVAVDINTGDTTAFIALPGIGSKLASRIINFRDKLGGFYSISQVGETFGLPDSTFQKIKQYLKLETSLLKKININTATVDELKAHPYIKYNLANPIVAYRNQHGPFSRLEDLKKIMAVTDEVYTKIAPYLRAD